MSVAPEVRWLTRTGAAPDGLDEDSPRFGRYQDEREENYAIWLEQQIADGYAELIDPERDLAPGHRLPGARSAPDPDGREPTS